MDRAVCGNDSEAPRHAGLTAVAAPFACWLATAVALGALAGCSGTGPAGMDGGRDRDGTVVDSTLTADDASADAPVPDAATADGGGVPACGGECDPRDATACGALQCLMVSGAPACGTGAGMLLAGASCEHAEDCGPGLACFADSATGLGVCAEVCCPGDATCGVDRRCGGGGELVGGVTTAWARCISVRACDLAHPEFVCALREGCYIVDSEGHTECLIAGTALEGEPCGASDDCAPGGVCTGIGDKRCARVCLLDTPRDCGTDRRCEAQAYSPPGTGICTPSLL